MPSKRRALQEINAGSMADIAFLLLVFFLVTTTMDSDWGLARRLPPPLDINQPEPPPIKDRNVFVVLANANDQLLVEGEILEKRTGSEGFGYDPIFIPQGSDKTFAQLSPAEKNNNSHRALAVQKLKQYLNASM